MYLILLFVVPLVLVFVYSFATRDATGQTVLEGWNLDSYRRLFSTDVLEIFLRSIVLAVLTTLICLVICYPFAFYIATRHAGPKHPARPRDDPLLVQFPGQDICMASPSRLRRTPVAAERVAGWRAVSIALHQRRCPDRAGVRLHAVHGPSPLCGAGADGLATGGGGADLYADGWTAFRKVTLPLSMPGVVAGSILVFIPSLGAYVTPALLGGARTVLMGDYIVSQFLAASELALRLRTLVRSDVRDAVGDDLLFPGRGEDIVNEGTAPRGAVDRLLGLNAWVVYIFFYAPILLLIVFSFNDNNNVGIWTQPSFAGTERCSRTSG